MGGIPALLARSTEPDRKPLITSGPALRLVQEPTLNGRLSLMPDSFNATSLAWLSMFIEVPGGTVDGSAWSGWAFEAADLSLLPLPPPQATRPSVAAAPESNERNRRRSTTARLRSVA